jgi:hypothetical protein
MDGPVYDDRSLRGYSENHCQNRVLAMLRAGILGFMLPRDPEEGFSADPPIQRSKGRYQSLGAVSYTEENTPITVTPAV